MIIAKTKLRKIPNTCLKCKFCMNVEIVRNTNAPSYGYFTYMKKKCVLNGAIVPYVYNSAKHNWEYIKCKNCPLQEV